MKQIIIDNLRQTGRLLIDNKPQGKTRPATVFEHDMVLWITFSRQLYRVTDRVSQTRYNVELFEV